MTDCSRCGWCFQLVSDLCNITLEVKLKAGAPHIQRGKFPPQRAEYQMVGKQKGALEPSRGSHTTLWPT